MAFTAVDWAEVASSGAAIGTLALAEEAASRGITRIDLGHGQDRHKFQRGTPSYSVAGGAVWATHAEAVGRTFYRRLPYDRQGHQPDQ